MYDRDLHKHITNWLKEDEILIIFGARQVGKTTLLNQLLAENKEALILNCERPAVNEILESKDPERIKALFGNHHIIALDEAQTILNIGKILKLIYDDHSMNFKLIATGSSSFDLANKITEPLTGRNIKFRLFPLTLNELNKGNGWLWIQENLENLMIFGSYPGIVNLSADKKKTKLEEISSDYLFKDILMHERIKSPKLLQTLLKSLALQIGKPVSIKELSDHLEIAFQTVERYLDLLEKTFVIFSLMPFSRNIRNEMKKNKKYYFYDCGIRNALLHNFSALDSRLDTGSLWENFIIAEKIKFDKTMGRNAQFYFWRTYDRAEIDLVEDLNGKINAFECKWNPRKQAKIPAAFAEKYEVESFKVINRESLHEIYLFNDEGS